MLAMWQRGWRTRDTRDILWEFGAGGGSWKKQRVQTRVISPKWWNRQGGMGGAAGRRALQGSFAQPWGSFVSFSRPGDVAVLLHTEEQLSGLAFLQDSRAPWGKGWEAWLGQEENAGTQVGEAVVSCSHSFPGSQNTNFGQEQPHELAGGSQEGMEVEGCSGHGVTPWAAALMGSTWHKSASGIGSLGTIEF